MLLASEIEGLAFFSLKDKILWLAGGFGYLLLKSVILTR